MGNTLYSRIKNKRDTSANWTSNNPVILDGEIILVDTADGELRAKIGDGSKTYTQLPFSDEALRSLITAKANATHTHAIADVNNLQTALNNKADSSDIPTKTSQLTNDSGFKTTDNNTTYSLSKSGSTITLTGSDGSTTSVTDSDTDTVYTLPSAGSSLGGVKSGGDVTISSGVITVNDDSHNHTIANVDGLQTELEELSGRIDTIETEAGNGTITGVSVNGTSVATSGVANIPAASTSAYGVTKLSSSTSSTSTTLAATPSAVKAAYDLAASKASTDPWSFVYDSDGDVLSLERDVSSYSVTDCITPYKVDASVSLTDVSNAYNTTDSTVYAAMETTTTARTATIYIDTEIPSNATISSMKVSFKAGTSNISSSVWSTRTYTVKCGGNTLGSGNFTLTTSGNVTTVTVSDVSKITSPVIEITFTAKTTATQNLRIYGAQVDVTYTATKEHASILRGNTHAIGEHYHSEYSTIEYVDGLVGDIESALEALL